MWTFYNIWMLIGIGASTSPIGMITKYLLGDPGYMGEKMFIMHKIRR
jgi:hypothetical protein